jgi:putative Holliday junction resolvase
MTDSPQLLGQTLEDADAFATLLAPGSRLIGMDLGTKTIGLALSDVNRSIASSMETIRRKKFSIDVLLLLSLANEHKIAGFVLGLPVNLNATEGPRAQATRSFARSLNQRSELPILLWDERMTTQAAQRLLIEADSSRKRRSEVVDKMAATLILQGALNRMR